MAKMAKKTNIEPKFKFTLGRKIDMYYPTNRYLVFGMLFLTLFAYVISQSITQSVLTTGGFFFAWAITREIDPLKEKAAFLSGFLTAVPMLFYLYDGIDLGTLFFVLLSLRFISGICGLWPTYADIFGVFLLAGYLSYSMENYIYFLILSIMFIFSWYRYSKNYIFLISSGVALGFSILFFKIYPVQTLFSSLPLSGVGIYVLRTIIIAITIYLYFSLEKDKGIKDDLKKDIAPGAIQKTLVYFAIVIMLLMTFANLTQNTAMILLSALLAPTMWRVVRL